MKKLIIISGIASLLLFAGTAAANVDNHESHQMTPEEHQNMSATTNSKPTISDEHSMMTDDEHADMTSHDNHNGTGATHEESLSEGHGGHDNIVETPPNIPVLAAFGVINSSFILIGVWMKWFRKKEAVA